MTSLFEEDSSPALNAGLMEELTASYVAKLLSNPPTPTFMPTNPKCEAAARYAAKRDVSQICREARREPDMPRSAT